LYHQRATHGVSDSNCETGGKSTNKAKSGFNHWEILKVRA